MIENLTVSAIVPYIIYHIIVVNCTRSCLRRKIYILFNLERMIVQLINPLEFNLRQFNPSEKNDT